MDDRKADHSGAPIMKRMVLGTAIFGHGGGKGGVRLTATATAEADMLRFGLDGRDILRRILLSWTLDMTCIY